MFGRVLNMFLLLAITCRYYPYHYSPYISDVANFEIAELYFPMAQPFQPFEQLLAVLPAASRKLLPSAFQVRIFCWSINLFCASFHISFNAFGSDWKFLFSMMKKWILTLQSVYYLTAVMQFLAVLRFLSSSCALRSQ